MSAAAAATVAAWGALAESLAADAALLFNAVNGLSGQYGRYAVGGLATPLPATATVESVIAAATSNRAALAAAVAAAILAAQSLDPTGVECGAAVFAVAQALQAAANDPADQIRLLTALADFFPVPLAAMAPVGLAVAAITVATASLCRRAALITLAVATSLYQPSSYDDALTQQTNVCALFDAESLVAADAGDENSYMNLRALRAAVAQDLAKRGSQLPQLITVTTGLPMPALALAWRLYQDADRTMELIGRADPPCPLFMPTSFQALAS